MHSLFIFSDGLCDRAPALASASCKILDYPNRPLAVTAKRLVQTKDLIVFSCSPGSLSPIKNIEMQSRYSKSS